MQWRTFSIGWILALAVLLFAQRRPHGPQAFAFRQAVDLTRSAALKLDGDHINALAFSTRIDEPIEQINGQWMADPVTADRLVAPLVVLDVRDRAAADPNYQIDLSDIARWESQYGHVPPGAVVLARSGWRMPTVMPKEPIAHLAFSLSAVQFLVRARMVYGIGSDAPSVDPVAATDMPVRRYAGENHVYCLANVANLDTAPANGGILTVGPTIIRGAAGAPVHLMALVH